MKQNQNVPRCLQNRYIALNEFISSLDAEDKDNELAESGIKLLCSFWSILRDHPNFNLAETVRNYINHKIDNDDEETSAPEELFHQKISCFMASEKGRHYHQPKTVTGETSSQCDELCDRSKKNKGKSQESNDSATLDDILNDLNEASKLRKNCVCKLKQLLEKDKKIKEKLKNLEERERLGSEMLKKAEQLWAKMEKEYKEKIEKAKEQTKETQVQMLTLEASTQKWKRYNKDLEQQVEKLKKAKDELKSKIEQKKKDQQVLNKEIEKHKKTIAKNEADAKNYEKNVQKKKAENDEKMKKYEKQIEELKNELKEEEQKKQSKEKDGNMFIKDAREDLKRVQKELLKKEMDNESLIAERQKLIEEVCDLSDRCRCLCAQCEYNENELNNTLKMLDEEIEQKEKKSLRCSRCTHTEENRKYCVDCPTCKEDRVCAITGDFCANDPTLECICQTIKQRFIENVFNNMQVVVTKEVKTRGGKIVAESVLNCLKRSANGKLDIHTKEVLKTFMLKNIGKNLTNSIIGGAVKTRCELDATAYNALMTCLNKSKPGEIKAYPEMMPCKRWGGTDVCHCPRKPKDKRCICEDKSKATREKPCPDSKEDLAATGYSMPCPHNKDQECGADCGAHKLREETCCQGVKWDPEPCRSSESEQSKDFEIKDKDSKDKANKNKDGKIKEGEGKNGKGKKSKDKEGKDKNSKDKGKDKGNNKPGPGGVANTTSKTSNAPKNECNCEPEEPEVHTVCLVENMKAVQCVLEREVVPSPEMHGSLREIIKSTHAHRKESPTKTDEEEIDVKYEKFKKRMRKGSPLDKHRRRLIKEVMGLLSVPSSTDGNIISPGISRHKKGRKMFKRRLVPNNKAMETVADINSLLSEANSNMIIIPKCSIENVL